MESLAYLPNSKEIKNFFSDLLAKNITVTDAKVISYPFNEKILIGSLVDSTSGEIKVLLLCDLAFACFGGAALAMIPAGVAKENIKENEITASMLENIKEIVNIASSLCNKPDFPHLRLKEVFGSDSLPEHFTALLAKKPVKTYDVEIEIASYGKGKFSFLSY